MVQQLKKNDVWIIVDGDEGSGKTNMATYILYYFHCATGRDFTQDRLYFDSDEMFEWVKENMNGLVNWDEAALGGLSTEWWSRAQSNLMKFAMTGRKKHHVFVLCIPKFNKLQEYLRVDRSIALIHMDMGKTKTKHGHAMYITRRGKAELNRLYAKTKQRFYGKCMRSYGGFGFDIPYVFDKLVDEVAYDKKKDEAISNIGKKRKDGSIAFDEKVSQNMINNYNNPPEGWTKTQVAQFYGVSTEYLRKKAVFAKENEKIATTTPNIINNEDSEKINDSEQSEEDTSNDNI